MIGLWEVRARVERRLKLAERALECDGVILAGFGKQLRTGKAVGLEIHRERERAAPLRIILPIGRLLLREYLFDNLN